MRRVWGVASFAFVLLAAGAFWQARSRGGPKELVPPRVPGSPAEHQPGPAGAASAEDAGFAPLGMIAPAKSAPAAGEGPGGRTEPDGAGEARRLVERGQVKEGLRLLTARWRSSTSEAERARIWGDLGPLLERHVWSGAAPEEIAFTHVLASGESLYGLCLRWRREGKVRAAPGLILRMNGVAEARRLRAGTALRVPREPVGLEIHRGRFRLAAFLGDVLLREYPVGLGSGERTPLGEFQIEVRLKNPHWTTPEGVIPYGDPRNILGTRWLGFRDAGGRSGLGIHGTTDPDSIGTDRSAGCVRMHNRDVEELFEWIPEETQVRVLP